jgi:hypothetical protein
MQTALTALPALPCALAVRELDCEVRVLSAAARTLRVAPAAPAGGLPAILTLFVPAEGRCRHEIELQVLRRTGASHWLARPLAIATVPDPGRRGMPRGASAHMAVVAREPAESLPSGAGEEYDVRLIDLSGDGLAFTTERDVAAGDRMSCMLNFDDRLVFTRLCATNVTATGLGRHRVGCRIVEIAEPDRRALIRYANANLLPDRRRDAIEAVRAAVRRLAAAG